jgi:hypothetical protein
VAEPITVKFSGAELHPDDRAFLVPQKTGWPLFFGCTFALLLVTLLYGNDRNPLEVLAAAGIVAAFGLLWRAKNRPSWREQDAMLLSSLAGTYQIDDEGVMVHREHITIAARWDWFSSALETEASFWLVDRNGQHWFVPKEDENGEQGDAVRETIVAHLENPPEMLRNHWATLRKRQWAGAFWLAFGFVFLVLWFWVGIFLWQSN